jgi:hypothetical protein
LASADPNAPILTGPSAYDSTFTHATCLAFCTAQPGSPFRYFGLEGGNLCRCGSDANPNVVRVSDLECNRAAAGNSTEAGGGLRRQTTYLNPLFPVRPRFSLVCSKLALLCFAAKVGIG